MTRRSWLASMVALVAGSLWPKRLGNAASDRWWTPGYPPHREPQYSLEYKHLPGGVVAWRWRLIDSATATRDEVMG